MAKPDIVPGWSDLDLIAFLKPSNDRLSDLAILREGLVKAKDEIEIGIGLDIVYEDEFLVSKKICGRPRAMTYEVALYGIVCFGSNPFETIAGSMLPYNDLRYEKFVAISAEIHNWRRAFMAYDSTKPDSTRWDAQIIKTALKLLKHEVGASKEPPFTHQGNLDRFLTLFPTHPAKKTFSQAVDLRREWLKYSNEPKKLKEMTVSINQILASYPLPSKPEFTSYHE